MTQPQDDRLDQLLRHSPPICLSNQNLDDLTDRVMSNLGEQMKPMLIWRMPRWSVACLALMLATTGFQLAHMQHHQSAATSTAESTAYISATESFLVADPIAMMGSLL